MIVLHEVSLFYYLTEAADSSSMDGVWMMATFSTFVFPSGLVIMKVTTTSIHVRWQEWSVGEYVEGEVYQLKGDGTNFPHCIIQSC